MVTMMLLGIAGCLLLGVCYRLQKQPWQFSMAITCGVIAYHMLIRFLSPVILQFIFTGSMTAGRGGSDRENGSLPYIVF